MCFCCLKKKKSLFNIWLFKSSIYILLKCVLYIHRVEIIYHIVDSFFMYTYITLLIVKSLSVKISNYYFN